MRWNILVSAFRGRARSGRPAGLAFFLFLLLAVLPHQTFGQSAGQSAGQSGDGSLVRLVQGLPWPGVSSLIGYRGRLWFANAVKFVNHNSADLYSFDPGSGKARYEKHLFSQDAGDPVVSDGLLYWPFEDSRFSPGHGEFKVTNGRDWDWHVIPKGRAFHTHAMASAGGNLYAAISAWSAKIAVSGDRGATWRLGYEFPTPDGKVSRITALTDLDGTVFAGITTWYDESAPKLIRMGPDGAIPIPGWPSGSAVAPITAFKGWVYAVNAGPDGSALWRTDGKRVEKLTGPDGTIDAFASDGSRLWAVTARRRSGALWQSDDGIKWRAFHRFDGVRPLSIGLLGGKPYVGVLSDKGGALWGPANHVSVSHDSSIVPLPVPPSLSDQQRRSALASLDRALADRTQYRRLRFAVRPLALDRSKATAAALVKRLEGPFPAGSARMFGRRQIATDRMAQWYLLWAIAHNGHGRVPLRYLHIPWTSKPNRAEKYIQLPLAAAWSAARLNQRDHATLSALMKRLDSADDPKWLTGDMVGALTDLTGKRFAYDLDAWRRWWREKSSP